MFQASQNNRKRPKPNSISSYFQKVEKHVINNESSFIKTNISPSKSDLDTDKHPVTVCQTDPDAGSINKDIVVTGEPLINESQNPLLESTSIDRSLTNDIGLFVNKKTDDFTKCQLLERHWRPPKSYDFPHSLHTKTGKEVKRYLGHQHLEQRKWLVFSHVEKGLFCKFCVLFSDEKCGHNKGMVAQNLVTRPLTSFAKLLGKDGFIQTHENTAYHKVCVQAGLDFLQSYHNPDKSIDNQINSQRLKQVQENRERLRPIIESIVFLGRQNIPLRGHRDDGRLDEEAGPSNEGNFRELLRFKISSGDETLKQHLATASSRATYIGNTTQNQLITCCGEEITETILSQVQNARYYSVIFDETTDISHTEQLSLNLRYLHNNEIREDFVKFIDAYDNIKTISLDENVDVEQRLSGEALGKIVVNLLQELSLDLNNCVGIGTDSCSVMSSVAVGAVSEIQKVAKHACRCPCLNHVLNNSLSTSVNVASIRNTVGTMKSVVSFFHMSAKRNQVLKLKLGRQLMSLCETRWVERHEGVIQFRSGICQIVEALTLISSWKDSKSSSVAAGLLNSLCTTEFLTAMLSLIDVLKITLPLSRLLQTPSLDVNQASSAVSNTMTTLQERRFKCDEIFKDIFFETSHLAEELDVDMKLPRLTSRQTKRSNHPGDIEEYYRRSVYIPLLDNVCADLTSRLSSSSLECFGLRGIIPTNLVATTREKEDGVLINLKRGFKQFASIIGSGDVLTNEIMFEGEMVLWKNYWEKEKEKNIQLPEDVLKVLDACDPNIFPMVHDVLKVLVTLPGIDISMKFNILFVYLLYMGFLDLHILMCGLCSKAQNV